MAIDLRHLRCFVAVAQELHFHRAAKTLGVAQPALSRTIKTLENELGVTLLDRSNRRVDLTEAGKSFLADCRECLEHSKRIVEDVKRFQHGNIGRLRISYTDNAMNGRLPSLLKAFKDHRPDIKLMLTHSVTSEQLSQLEEGSIDFGFATGTVSRAGLNFIPIQSERFVCVVYKDHPFAHRTSLHLAELASEPMIQGVKEHWTHYHSHLAPLFAKAGFEPRIVQEGLTTSDIQRLVACGIGIAVLTETVLDGLPSDLVVVPIKDLGEQLDTNAIWRSFANDPAKEHFVAFLNQSMCSR